MATQQIIDFSGPTMMVYRAFSGPKTSSNAVKESTRPALFSTSCQSTWQLDPSYLHARTPNTVNVSPIGYGSKIQRRPQSTQELTFVNARKPNQNLDPKVRRIIRSHVTKDSSVKQRKGIRTSAQNIGPVPAESVATITTRVDVPEADLSGWALNSPFGGGMMQYTESLNPDTSFSLRSMIAHHIVEVASCLYPLGGQFSFDPHKRMWVDYMKNQMAVHAGLYLSTTCLGLMRGAINTPDATRQLNLAIQIINAKLDEYKVTGHVEDELIGAVSCLAMVGALLGDGDQWEVHMRGVKRMIDLRGGASELNLALQMKLNRCDTVGCTTFLGTPILQIDMSSIGSLETLTSAIPSVLLDHSLSDPFIKLLYTNGISISLIAVMKDLSLFSRAVQYTFEHIGAKIDPFAFTAASNEIQHALLRLGAITTSSNPSSPASVHPDALPTPASAFVSAHLIELDVPLRLAGILYMKPLLWKDTRAAITSIGILSQMHTHLLPLSLRPGKPETHNRALLLVWIYLIAAVAATPNVVSPESSKYRAFFIERLAETCQILGLGESAAEGGVIMNGERLWEDLVVLIELNRLPWLERVHGIYGGRLWAELDEARKR